MVVDKICMRRLGYIFVLILFILPGKSWSQEDVKIRRSSYNTGIDIGLREAWKSVKDGDRNYRDGKGTYDLARDHYLYALQYNPDHPALNYKLGICYLFTDQKYEAISYLLIFVVSFIFYRKKHMEVRDGFMFSVFMIAMFTARLLIEFVKNDQVGFESGMTLNMGQWLSLPFILAGIAMIMWTKNNPRHFNQTPIPKQVRKADKKTNKKS